MRTLTHKRIFSAVLATGLAASAMVALAATSDAATAKLKADATTSAGATLTITGTDLLDDNGVPNYSLTAIRFSSAACAATVSSLTVATASTAAVTASGGTTATTATAISDTKITLDTTNFVPTLVAGKAKYNVCVYDPSLSLFGSTTTTFYSTPATITAGVATLAGNATSNVYVGSTAADSTGSNLNGPSLGGTKITVKGLDFTSKTYVTVGGKKLNSLKVAIAKVSTDADVITGTLPAGTGTQAIKIVGEFGSYPVGITGVTYATVAAGPVSWTYKQSLSVSPSGSDGAAGRVVTVTGVGFDNVTFANTFTTLPSSGNTATVIAVVPGGTNLDTVTIANNAYFQGTSSAFLLPTNIKYCGGITKNSDTELTCTLPTGGIADGAYSIVVLKFSSTTMTSASAISRGATYVAADF